MLWFLAQIKFFNVFLFSVIGRMIYLFYWHFKKKENFMRNKSTSPSIFIILGHQSSVTLNDLLDIKMDFFAANPNIVSCRPPRARRPIHCYHPNNVHHIHFSLLQSSCALLHYVVLTAFWWSTNLQGSCTSVTECVLLWCVPPVLKTRGSPNTQARVSTPSGTRLSSTKTSSWSRYEVINPCYAHFDVVKGMHGVVLHRKLDKMMWVLCNSIPC